MTPERRPETLHAGTFSVPPDADGWQVSYELGVQDDDLVITAVRIDAPIARGEHLLRQPVRGVPHGGLTAERARALIKPGTTIRKFLMDAVEGNVVADGKLPGSSPSREFREWIAWLKTLPALRQLVRRGPFALLPRRQRIALTAAAYLMACAEGGPAPRKSVAEAQGRDEAAVRDDLHAARHESPPLLAGGGQGKRGGTLTDEGKTLIAEIQRAMGHGKARAAKPTRKGHGR